MDRKTNLIAGLIGSATAFVSALVLVFGLPAPEPGVVLQPSFPPVAKEVFLRGVTQAPELCLQFFTADSFFILGYLMVFIGLFTITQTRSAAFAGVGLGAGILTAILDAAENSFFITLASLAKTGAALTDVPHFPVFIIANLKWMAAFTAATAFCLIWPRKTWLDRTVAAALSLFVIVGVLGTFLSRWIEIRGFFFLVGMILFGASFARRLLEAARDRVSVGDGL